MRFKAKGRRYTPAEEICEVTEVKLDDGWRRYIREPYKHDHTVVIIPDEQLWGELLAYAGMPPPDDHPTLMAWIQDVLKALSEMQPESSARSRLNAMASFSDYCKEKRNDRVQLQNTR